MSSLDDLAAAADRAIANPRDGIAQMDFEELATASTVLRLVAVARAAQGAAEVIDREGWEVYYADERFVVSTRLRAALAALEEVR